MLAIRAHSSSFGSEELASISRAMASFNEYSDYRSVFNSSSLPNSRQADKSPVHFLPLTH